MIVSCSRRTDVPAFFGDWFIDKIKKGYCVSVNPFNSNQRTYVPLGPEDVDLFVFWTKNPRPFMENVDILKALGYKFYFQYTLNDYPKYMEPNVPVLENRVNSLIELSDIIGKDRVIWRYDPMILTQATDYKYHEERFGFLLEKLHPYIERVIISIYDNYVGADRRLEKYGLKVLKDFNEGNEFKELMKQLSSISNDKGLKVYSCAETINLTPYGISAGKCIDDEYIERVFNIKLPYKKDRNQRKECGCIESKDIGFYNTCPHKCIYCYANRSSDGVDRNISTHKYDSPSLIGWYNSKKDESENKNEQLRFI